MAAVAHGGLWADVHPIPQDDGPDPLVPIMYTDDYRNAMDLFRAISVTEERSDRVLELTEKIIRLNPAHYTVWNYRLETLLALKKDLLLELRLMDDFARVNLKTYQVWHHRQLLLTHISPSDPSDEIQYIHDALLPDPKNYHTWAYLHWLYSQFADRISPAQWLTESAWCDELLRVDGRNNSAWAWKWYLHVDGPNGGDPGSEIPYTLEAIKKIPHNISAWNFLRGLLKLSNTSKTEVSAVVQGYATNQRISYALELQAELMEEDGRVSDAAEVYGTLSEVDPMRAAFWQMRLERCR